MTFAIQTYQTPFLSMIGVLLLFLVASLVSGLSLASRVMSARIENTTRTLRGRMDGGTTPLKALHLHKQLAVITLTLTAAMILLMLSLLGDCRINIVNDDASNVLTVTGQVEEIEHRSLLDGTVPFFTEDGPTFGVRLGVDGEEYHVLSDSGLAAGDTVTLQFLSGSRFVLYAGRGSELPYPAITLQESIAAKQVALEAVPTITTMTFPFKDYRRIVLFETGLCILLVIITLRTILSAVMKLLCRKLKLAEGLQTTLSVFTFVLLLTISCSSVWNGGWQVLLEKNSDAITLQGEIQSVEVLESTRGVKFSTEWGTHFGCYITIDGEEYFAMYEGDLAEGDVINILYLPKSRYVLSISAKEE